MMTIGTADSRSTGHPGGAKSMPSTFVASLQPRLTHRVTCEHSQPYRNGQCCNLVTFKLLSS